MDTLVKFCSEKTIILWSVEKNNTPPPTPEKKAENQNIITLLLKGKELQDPIN